MDTRITVADDIMEEIIEGDRVLLILPEDREVPLGPVELATKDGESLAVNVLRTSRARLKHVPVSDRVLNGDEDLMKTLIHLRQRSDRDLVADDIVTVIRFEPRE